MDRIAHVTIFLSVIFLLFSFVSFSDDDIETISLSDVSRNGSSDFPYPQEVSRLHDFKFLTVTKSSFLLTFWRDYQRTSDENNEKHQLKDVLMNYLFLSGNFKDIYGKQ